MRKVNILETTLRDGSYAINFSFTSADTAVICRELENAGFKYIEIGHGVGLNASNHGFGPAAETDEEYMTAAENVLKRAKYGMFCIPGIARLEDIDLAAKHNMGFIRVGTNVTEVKTSEEYIKRAKDYGMFVTANYMKSYVLPPEKFAEKVRLSEKYGADMIYIVDSAGGMFTENIRNYYKAIRSVSNIAIGFHGHDNLGLAIANTLEAVKMGAEFVDASLQGLGRSAGNACTEVLVTALKKMGYETGIDFLKVLNIGKKYIQPLLTVKGRMPLDIVAGYADFHSSYMHHIRKYSAKYHINPAILIIEMCKVDKVHVDEEVLDKIAQRIKSKEDIYLGEYGFNRYVGGEQDEKKN
jgi:4-hydroxy 2-oxovalerate aldolase/long-chain acyl-CoA synthetase